MKGGFTDSSPPPRIAPKEQVGLGPYEMLYGRPFVYVNDLFLDPEAQTLQSYTMAIGQFQQDIRLWCEYRGAVGAVAHIPRAREELQVCLRSDELFCRAQD